MRESLMYGSVRGARGNSRPYRDAVALGLQKWSCEARRSMDWDDYLRQQTPYIGNLPKNRRCLHQARTPRAAVCEDVANNIEDRLASG